MKMLINGEWMNSEEWFEVENPVDNSVLDRVPSGSREDVELAADGAQDAFRDWSGKPYQERGRVLNSIADVLEGSVHELAGILVKEVGKPLPEAKHEVLSAACVFRAFSNMKNRDELIEDDTSTMIRAVRKPIGVSGLILPWNYPLTVLSWKLAPALLAGNTVIVKPSPYTPLNALKFGELTQSFLPPGVVNIVTGGDGTGRSLVGSKKVDRIAFTGNVETGKEILKQSAESLKKVTLELGGNDPALVQKDFDLKNMSSLFWSSFRNAGQICIAVKRVYVHEAIYPAFLEKYVGLARNVRVGDGMKDGTQMGPVNNQEQLEKVGSLVDDAQEHGGRILCGGVQPGGPGYFYPPTVVTDVDEDVELVSKEQFGPAIPIMPYHDIDEAIERANSLRYGLGASVWTDDTKKGLEVASRIESGTVWVNTHMVVDPRAPFGGFKESGMGRELGYWGLDEFLEIQTQYLKK